MSISLTTTIFELPSKHYELADEEATVALAGNWLSNVIKVW